MILGEMKADAITAAPVLIETLEDIDSQVFIVKALGKMGSDIISLLIL